MRTSIEQAAPIDPVGSKSPRNFNVPRLLPLLAVTASLAAANPISSEAQEAHHAQDNAYINEDTYPIPNVFKLARAAREQAKSENQNWEYLGPNDKELANGISGAAGLSEIDKIKTVKMTPSKNGQSLKIRLRQQNTRARILVGVFKDPMDTDSAWIKNEELSVDADLLTDKLVDITPMLRPKKPGLVPRRWGKTVRLAVWGNFDPTTAAVRVQNGHEPRESLHMGLAIVKPKKPISKELVKSGRLYVNISQRCTLRDRSYDMYNQVCKKPLNHTYKVKSNRKATTYIDGRHTKPGDVLIHERKIK